MKTACLVMLWVGISVGSAHAADPQTLKEGSWVCHTPEAYDQAIESEKKRQGKDLEALKQQLLDQKLCMYVDDDTLEDMMAPWVKVLSQQGDRVKVAFTVEFYKRLDMLHRQFSRVQFTGWTDAGNVTLYYQ